MKNKKYSAVVLNMSLRFEIVDGCICWTSGRYGFENDDGTPCCRRDLPSEHNLLIHYLWKHIEGVNGEGELSLVNSHEQ